MQPFSSFRRKIWTDSLSTYDVFRKVTNKHNTTLVCQVENCSVILCGTIHIGNDSALVVQDVIDIAKPNYVFVEVCSERTQDLVAKTEYDISPANVLKQFILSRNTNTFLSEMSAWFQFTAAKMTGSKVGGEFNAALRSAQRVGAESILGDREYSITMQRVFDRATLRTGLKIFWMLLEAIFSLRQKNIADFVGKFAKDQSFVESETEDAKKEIPEVVEVVLTERDQYMARQLWDLGMVASRLSAQPSPPATLCHNSPEADTASHNNMKKSASSPCIVAVMGMAHLRGVQQLLIQEGAAMERARDAHRQQQPSSPHREEHPPFASSFRGIDYQPQVLTDELMLNITHSSRHSSQWPGTQQFCVVDYEKLFAGSPSSTSTI